MRGLERALGAALERNNRSAKTASSEERNPIDLTRVAWHNSMLAAYADIRMEWDNARDRGVRFPEIGKVLSEDQGQVGVWRAGLLIANHRPVPGIADLFPLTVAATLSIPGLRSALWSVLEPGAELPSHRGPNAGVLRYHLGVRCGTGAALDVDGQVVDYRDGVGVLFDDTLPHAAWNHGSDDRVTLFCEVERDLPLIRGTANRLVQQMLALDARYRSAPARAVGWHAALNPHLELVAAR